ncbi:MAG TPA: hypothetical protein VKF60_02055 [Myxococcota bacterium]|nr:hypothetical protein [Myxococcota bacterium]
MLVKLAIDFECPAPLWWQSGGRALWENLLESFDNSSVVIEESIARSWLAEAARIPGWSGGPEYAPSPILLKPIDEDQDV